MSTADGQRTTDLGLAALADEVLVNREGATGRMAVGDFAQQIWGLGDTDPIYQATVAAEGAAAQAEAAAATAATDAHAQIAPAVTAAQTAETGAIAARVLAETAAQNAQRSAYTCANWSDLAAIVAASAGAGAEVVDADTGTHTDPVVGGTVANAGRYSWSASPAGWQRIGDTGLAQKISLTDGVAANVLWDAFNEHSSRDPDFGGWSWQLGGWSYSANTAPRATPRLMPIL